MELLDATRSAEAKIVDSKNGKTAWLDVFLNTCPKPRHCVPHMPLHPCLSASPMMTLPLYECQLLAMETSMVPRVTVPAVSESSC